MNPLPKQCAILVGGLGTRLGSLTAQTPKPLLKCGDRPFLAWIMRELQRFGVEEFVLLAGFEAGRIQAFAERVATWLPRSASVEVSVEPAPLGTSGALRHAQALLAERFLLVNGDSWFDVNLAHFLASSAEDDGAIGHLLLRKMEEPGRYGSVELSGRVIRRFRERSDHASAAFINTGLYVFDRRIVEHLGAGPSLERDVLPRLAAAGALRGHVMDGYFIDIGIPADYARAGDELPRRLKRGAVFFDRDGVLNADLGWVGSIDRLHWLDGAREAVRAVNERGCHAFVVTNQAGVARGLFTESDVRRLHGFMADALLRAGATIDDWRYCPHHPEAADAAYRSACADRKPGPGMILDLSRRWNIDLDASVLIGDKDTDIEAARAGGIPALLYDGTRGLHDFFKEAVTGALA